MKFGENLYQRSVPKWAAYNVKYNELKHLIKERTSHGVAIPVRIPSAGAHRWQSLEDDLFRILQDEHNNVCLFLRSKQGEIERRLVHLEKQVRTAQQAINTGTLDRPIRQARRYQRLVKDAEGIGEELDLLSRFAAVQKTAFRKILKKYRKWTGSTGLQERLSVEVFSSGALQFDYVEYRTRLSTLTHTINGLARALLTGHQRSPGPNGGQSTVNQSNARNIIAAALQGPLSLDVALETVPYGEFSGSHYYWIHPDNLEEAESLLLRHMHIIGDQLPLKSPGLTDSTGAPEDPNQTYLAVYDNAQRCVQDLSSTKPSNVAVTARWMDDQDALVTLSSMVPRSTGIDIIQVKRKELGIALQRSTEIGVISTPGAKQYSEIRSYLSEHRDVKPLAESHSIRSRYSGNTNSSEVGTWATLDTSISFSPVETSQLGLPNPKVDAGEAFPHAVLHIRWEFSRMPEVARLFDTSHLAERVHDFSLEKASIYTVCQDLEQPKWRQLLETDIRKVPEAIRRNRIKAREFISISTSSGPSSSEGANNSVFSAGGQFQSSATSLDQSPSMSFPETSDTGASKRASEIADKDRRRKKRARIADPPIPERQSSPPRYWNEFDDGDSDVNQEESYAIYVDPNEESFPGAETFSRVFGSMYDSLSRGKKTVVSWLPIKSKADDLTDDVRTPLLFDGSKRQNSFHADLDSSGSDTDELVNKLQKRKRSRSFSNIFPSKYRRHQPLSRRQRVLERTLFQFYSGLIAIAYVLLVMAAILESTGRKKRVLQVDAGVVAGVAGAEACATMSIALIFMRRKALSTLHWGTVFVNATVIGVLGIAELTMIFTGR